MDIDEIHPSKIGEIGTLYDFIDGKNIYSQVYEGKFLEHKKGEIIFLSENRHNKQEDGILVLETTRVREGDYKIIKIIIMVKQKAK